MTSKYSIIQYFPNPINGERINIGVVVISGNQLRVQILNSWSRVESFACTKADVEMLHKFTTDLSYKAGDGIFLADDSRTNMERLEYVAANWSNVIQFTALRGSLDDIDVLLPQLVKDFLVN